MADSQLTQHTVQKRPLDDVMLAMDVVDTLRHRATLVERELAAEQRDQQLIDRLREIYAAQGIDVPDHVLAEGVTALQEDRFTYTPPKPGFSVSLAKFYISRDRWMKPLLVVLGLLAAACLGYLLLVTIPRNRELRDLPGQIAAQVEVIDDLSQIEQPKNRARQFAARAQQALSEKDLKTAQRELQQMQELRVHLAQEYQLRIVSEGSTGVWRVPNVNEAARNYYIIVQAVTAQGQILTLPISSEEDGKTKQVTKWGLRVDEKTFHEIAADKQDDGIIQRNQFGIKKAGYLEPEYQIQTTGGAITSW